MNTNFSPDGYYEGRPVYDVTGRIWLQELLRAQLAFAIASFEGFFTPGSISQRNNNPGNLRPIGASVGFQVFTSPAQGWKALVKQIMINVSRGLTLREFFLGKPGVYPGYAPLGDNDPDVMENYIEHVASLLNMSQDIDLRWYFPDISSSPHFRGFRWVSKGK